MADTINIEKIVSKIKTKDPKTQSELSFKAGLVYYKRYESSNKSDKTDLNNAKELFGIAVDNNNNNAKFILANIYYEEAMEDHYNYITKLEMAVNLLENMKRNEIQGTGADDLYSNAKQKLNKIKGGVRGKQIKPRVKRACRNKSTCRNKRTCRNKKTRRISKK